MLTVPWKRRWLLSRRSDLADGVLRVALQRIESWYKNATGRREGKSGAVTAIQRFGSALNLNLHYHMVHLDGLFDRGADGALQFFHHTPTTEDIEGLVVEIGLASERWLARQGFAGEAEDSSFICFPQSGHSQPFTPNTRLSSSAHPGGASSGSLSRPRFASRFTRRSDARASRSASLVTGCAFPPSRSCCLSPWLSARFWPPRPYIYDS